MSYITVQEAAERWDISERRVQMFCREGRIPGAFKRNSAWMIPEGAPRPGRSAQKHEKAAREVPADATDEHRFHPRLRCRGGENL